MENEIVSFGKADTAIFVAMLLLSMGVGIYYAIRDRKQANLDLYFYGGKNMSPIPVGLSLGVTFISSIALLSIPVLAYNKGTVVFWYGLSIVACAIPAYIYYIPLIQRLQLPTIYKYLELRFHVSVRRACSFIFCVYMILWMGTANYLTALALNVVSPLGVTSSIILTTCIVTFYTVLGGIRAVVWVDAIQSTIMIGGMVTIAIKASFDYGGFSKTWEILEENNRTNFLNFDPDVTVENSFWTIVIGLGTAWSNYYCCNQSLIQRFQSCKNTKDSRIACVISSAVSCILIVASVLCGCIMFVYFQGCDPFLSGQIAKQDQAVPFLVITLFHNLPGMAGLFVATAYSGMLSTVSSGMNSLSTLILEDLIRPFWKNLSENTAMRLSRLIGVVLGVIVAGAGFMVAVVESEAVKLMNTIDSTFGGPMIGLFTTGVFFPWANRAGGLIGFVCGVLFNFWVVVGQMIYGRTPGRDPVFPTSISNCSQEIVLKNFEFFNKTTSAAEILEPERPLIADTLYQVSYLYIGCQGFIFTVIVSLIVSFITGAQKPEETDPAFFMPMVDLKFLPAKINKFFRFGVPAYLRHNSDFYVENLSEKATMSNLVGNNNDGEVTRTDPLLMETKA